MKSFEKFCEKQSEPDFNVRGYMLDISRCKVPTLTTLKRLITILHGLRYNQFQLYTEHTFAYAGHETVWRDASPLTPDEIEELDAYCAERGIELVPNQNSFGHMERWLRHPEYHHLAESPEGFTTPWGEFRQYGSVLKPNDESLALVDDLYTQLLPHFRSRTVNIGGDEPWELGQGWSKPLVEAEGKHELYLRFLKQIYTLTEKHEHRMQCWADIVLERPDLIDTLPKSIVPITWGYEADHPFAKQCAQLAAVGMEFMVAPGDSTWNSTLGRLDNARECIVLAASEGHRHGALGLLMTQWGDNGHGQPWVLTLPAMVIAGMAAWHSDDSEALPWQAVLSHDIFKDETGKLAQALEVMGSVERCFSQRIHNQSVLFQALVNTAKDVAHLDKVTPDEHRAVSEKLDTAEALARASQPTCDDAELLLQELAHAIAVSRLALKRLLMIQANQPRDELRDEYSKCLANHERIWLARNRPGGLTESSGYLRRAMANL